MNTKEYDNKIEVQGIDWVNLIIITAAVFIGINLGGYPVYWYEVIGFAIIGIFILHCENIMNQWEKLSKEDQKRLSAWEYFKTYWRKMFNAKK